MGGNPPSSPHSRASRQGGIIRASPQDRARSLIIASWVRRFTSGKIILLLMKFFLMKQVITAKLKLELSDEQKQ
ncbi:MAG: hypothetical protein ACRDBG_22700, partial [Waterburya sp.]